MAEFAVKYGVDADGLQVMDLIDKKDFLAKRLGIPEHLLQVLSWKKGSVVITYRILQDVLPLAELALYREDAQGVLTQDDVKAVYFNSHPSDRHDRVCSVHGPWIVHGVFSMALFPPPMQVDQSPQTVHCKDTHSNPVTSDSLLNGPVCCW